MSNNRIISSNSFRGQNIFRPVYLLGFQGLETAFLLSVIVNLVKKVSTILGECK